jgi:hypothetical protein
MLGNHAGFHVLIFAACGAIATMGIPVPTGLARPQVLELAYALRSFEIHASSCE